MKSLISKKNLTILTLVFTATIVFTWISFAITNMYINPPEGDITASIFSFAPDFIVSLSLRLLAAAVSTIFVSSFLLTLKENLIVFVISTITVSITYTLFLIFHIIIKQRSILLWNAPMILMFIIFITAIIYNKVKTYRREKELLNAEKEELTSF